MAMRISLPSLPAVLVPGLIGLMFTLTSGFSHSEGRWWPEQKPARELVVLDSGEFAKLSATHGGAISSDNSRTPYHMLAASAAGLAAQAVNEGRYDALIWIAMRGNRSSAEWLERLLRRTGMVRKKSPGLWPLISQLAQAGVVKGYILYRQERINRDDRKDAPADESANAATVMAGLLGGILVEENLQAEAEKAGLKLLLDARQLTEEQVFAQNRDKLNRNCAMLQTPELPFGRDLAIAHRMMVMIGREAPTPEVYAWMEPIGTVYGWNLDPEDKAVGQVAEQGHIIVPCDWAPNLPALSCGAPATLAGLATVKFQTPQPVPVRDDQSAAAVVMSDGDNLQWALTTFAHNPKYWANPLREEFPMSWGFPVGDLMLMAPDAYAYYVETQGARTSIMVHMGYYYPDTFGKLRGPAARVELLKRLAQRIELVMQASGTTLLTFLVMDLDSDAAREAYAIFAQEIPSLTGMFAIQYHPYEGGEGEVFWFKRRDGADVPVTTASYAIWKASEKRLRGQIPSRLAETVTAAAESADAAGRPFSDWIIAHAWSEFPEDIADQPGALPQGVDPVQKFSRLVNGRVPIVTAEQIVERLKKKN